jgi:drug/metabolite transporter (DMT)-like permease
MLSENSNARGIAALCATMALFVANDGFLKMAAAELPVPQEMALRGLFACVSLTAIMAAGGRLGALRGVFRPLVGLRALIEFSGAFAFISALPGGSLANLTAIQQIVPLLMTAFAALFLRERLSAPRLIAVCAGFTGAVMIAQPTASSFSLGSLAAVYTAVSVCARDLITRGLPRDIDALALALVTSAFVGLCSFGVGAAGGFDHWLVPSGLRLLQCAGAGLFVGLAHLCIVVAMRHGEVRTVAPFYYSQTIFGLLYGFLVFGDRPNALALAGMAMIVGAGLFVILTRDAARTEPAAA